MAIQARQRDCDGPIRCGARLHRPILEAAFSLAPGPEAGHRRPPEVSAGRYGAPVARGRLISIEGLDGAGKSTLARALRDELAARGHDAELLREPGGVEVAERIRALLTDPQLPVSPRAEALLYAAARAQLVEQLLEPRLAAGGLVILDRFLDSSLAYQGGGRGLGLESIRSINRFAAGAVIPDVTLLLRISPELGLARKRSEGAPPDRLERESEDFFHAVARAYDELAAGEPLRIRAIDAEQAPRAVLASALAELQDLLAPPRAD
jgi:dTMP kinase